jgi:hypothetical protein
LRNPGTTSDCGLAVSVGEFGQRGQRFTGVTVNASGASGAGSALLLRTCSRGVAVSSTGGLTGSRAAFAGLQQPAAFARCVIGDGV